MEILSIEEMAKKHTLESCFGNQNDLMYQAIYDCTLAALTEQDTISRAEERERCIKVAQDVHCKMCELKDYCKIHGGEEDFECDSRDRIRKAIEEGNKE